MAFEEVNYSPNSSASMDSFSWILQLLSPLNEVKKKHNHRHCTDDIWEDPTICCHWRVDTKTEAVYSSPQRAKRDQDVPVWIISVSNINCSEWCSLPLQCCCCSQKLVSHLTQPLSEPLSANQHAYKAWLAASERKKLDLYTVLLVYLYPSSTIFYLINVLLRLASLLWTINRPTTL